VNMKIVATSNFDLETFNQYSVAENIKLKEFADVMCKSLNEKYCNHDNASIYYQVFEDEYKLYKFEV
jgi:hypothetical protein